MKIIDLSFNVEPNLSEPMSIKIKTRPHSGGSKFGRKIIFMGKRSLKRMTKNAYGRLIFMGEKKNIAILKGLQT